MKLKTSELTGAALDWAVTEAMKPSVKQPERFSIQEFGPLFGKGHKYPAWGTRKFSPSTDWSQGGPIIEREKITVDMYDPTNTWRAMWYGRKSEDPTGANGPTPLIAAMRCYAAAKLGDEVDVPDELLKD